MIKNKISILLCVVLVLTLLCSCSKKTIEPDVSSSQIPQSSQEQTSSVPEKEPSKYNDLFNEMTDCGKTLIPYGDLKEEAYSSALKELEAILDGYSRDISVVVYSLDNNKALAYNTEKGIFGACTVKAAYSLYSCKQMEEGKANLQTQMTYEKKHYEPGTGDMQYSPYGTVFSMETIIKKSMSISDNVGYMMQVDYFGRDGYNTWIGSLGCDSLKIKPTVWSLHTKAKDLAVVWREMYKYFETETEYSKFLYNSCTNTKDNYATAALKGVDISHKQGHNRSGDWLSYSDAGIVWKEGNPYIIAIVTNAPGPSSYDAGIFSQIINIVDTKLF